MVTDRSQDAASLPEGAVETPVVRYMSARARTLADHVAIYRDLKFVSRCCDLLLVLDDLPPRVNADESDDVVRVEALWSAAVIAYARCFNTGKRLGLTEDVLDQFDGDPHGFHGLLLNLRDKHIAHSVNPYETVVIGLALSPEGTEEPEVLGIAHLWIRHVVADREGVEALQHLAQALAREVDRMRQEETQEILAEARALDIETLYELERLRVTAPGPSDARTAR